MLDFSQPVALMLVAVLHFLNDEDKPDEVVGTLLDALPPGSYLAASHITAEHEPGVATGSTSTARPGCRCRCGTPTSSPGWPSPGWRSVPPGVVLVSEWRPDATGRARRRPRCPATAGSRASR